MANPATPRLSFPIRGKSAELAMVDEFELKSYSLKDFKLRSLGKDSALVTNMAHYEGKAGGQPIQALPTARYG
jgi:hypothetical protein